MAIFVVWVNFLNSPVSLLLHLADVELELLALEDVAVAAAGLAGPGRDAGQEAATVELVLKSGVDLAGGLTGSQLLGDLGARLRLHKDHSKWRRRVVQGGVRVFGYVPFHMRSALRVVVF